MADIGTSIKGVWMKSMEAIGNAASNIATSTRSKVDEMNLVNRKTEIMKELSNQAYVLWQKGEHFPAEIETRLEELKKLDEQLNDLRAERLAGVKTKTSETATEAEEIVEVMDTVEETGLDAEAVAAEIVTDAEDAADAVADAAEDAVPVIRVETTEPAKEEAEAPSSVSSAISDLFDRVPTAEEAAEKVNSALDSLEDGLKQFSDQMDEKIDELADHITGDGTDQE